MKEQLYTWKTWLKEFYETDWIESTVIEEEREKDLKIIK